MPHHRRAFSRTLSLHTNVRDTRIDDRIGYIILYRTGSQHEENKKAKATGRFIYIVDYSHIQLQIESHTYVNGKKIDLEITGRCTARTLLHLVGRLVDHLKSKPITPTDTSTALQSVIKAASPGAKPICRFCTFW